MISKSNAASALGTLEFVDSLAKYYRTTNVCQTQYVGLHEPSSATDKYGFKDVLMTDVVRAQLGNNKIFTAPTMGGTLSTKRTNMKKVSPKKPKKQLTRDEINNFLQQRKPT
jgi:hypothetical protein